MKSGAALRSLRTTLELAQRLEEWYLALQKPLIAWDKVSAAQNLPYFLILCCMKSIESICNSCRSQKYRIA